MFLRNGPLFVGMFLLLTTRLLAGEVTAPHEVARFEEMPKPVQLPDGTLAAYFLPHGGPGLRPLEGVQEVSVRYSRDNGYSWSEPVTLFELPYETGGWGYFIPLVD